MSNKPIFLLGEAKGANEAKIDAGFVGASGIELLRMLAEARIIELTSEDRDFLNKYYNGGRGINPGDPTLIDMIWRMHPEVYRSNVFQQHPPGNDLQYFCGPKKEGIPGMGPVQKSGYVRAEFQHELDRLGDEIISIDPNLIVCLGNTPLWALTNKTAVSKRRGTTTTSTHTVSGYKLLGTYHPSAVLRQWELRPVAVVDLIKARREAEFPDVRRPKCEIWIEPDVSDVERFVTEFVLKCEILSVDIETSGTRITEIGFSPRPDLAIVIPFDDNRRKDRCYWPDRCTEIEVWKIIQRVLGDRSIRKVFQNGLYDIAFLWRAYGIKVYNADEDTMLLHHALQPESLKSLGFLGSIYTDHGPWKTERGKSFTIKRDE